MFGLWSRSSGLRGEGQACDLWSIFGVDWSEGQVGLWSTWDKFGQGQAGIILVW